MLTLLSIKNLATISEASIHFDTGFSAITGDSGAGKSLLLSALNLVLGGRSNVGVIRHGCDVVDISAVFDISACVSALAYLTEYDLLEEGECILRRTINTEGRSKSSINGRPVSLNQIKALSILLVDIYGQNTYQTLLEQQTQQQLLDIYANNQTLNAQLTTVVKQYQDNQKNLITLKQIQTQQSSEIELLSYQLEELSQAQLDEQELQTIEQQHRISSQQEQLISQSNVILQSLEDNEQSQGLQQTLMTLTTQLETLSQIDETLNPLLTLFNSASINLQEVNYGLTHYLNKSSLNPQEYEQLALRLVELNGLASKHHCQIVDLYQVQVNISKQLEVLDNTNKQQQVLEQKSNQILQQYQKLCQIINQNRQSCVTKFCAEVVDIMQTLGMLHCQFQLKFIPNSALVSTSGSESVLFEISINAGQSYQSLTHSISGGELSRLNLAMAVLINQSHDLTTLVFDEVDSGVSGAIAQIVGQYLKSLASNRQVLCITHLAQVAAQGHQQFLISKIQENKQTHSKITLLTKTQRVEALARILDGKQVTQAAKQVAKNLLIQ